MDEQCNQKTVVKADIDERTPGVTSDGHWLWYDLPLEKADWPEAEEGAGCLWFRVQHAGTWSLGEWETPLASNASSSAACCKQAGCYPSPTRSRPFCPLDPAPCDKSKGSASVASVDSWYEPMGIRGTSPLGSHIWKITLHRQPHELNLSDLLAL